MSVLDTALNRVKPETRASWAHTGLLVACWAVGILVGTLLHFGQRVYPTRTVTHKVKAAPLGNASTAAQVAAAFDGKPAQSVTNAQLCPVPLAVYSDGKTFAVLVCKP